MYKQAECHSNKQVTLGHKRKENMTLSWSYALTPNSLYAQQNKFLTGAWKVTPRAL